MANLIYDRFGGKSPNALVHWKDGGELEIESTYTMLSMYEFRSYRCKKCGAICNGQTGEEYGSRIGYEKRILGKQYSIEDLECANGLFHRGL